MRCFVTVCCVALALQAQAASLERLFVQETQIYSNVWRLTLRGVLPFPNQFVAHPSFAADNWRVLLQHDVKLWYMPVYVMPDLQVAFEHQQRVPYPLTQGLYLINSQFSEDTDLQEVDFDTLIQMPQTRKALYEGGEWHDSEPVATMRPDRWRFVSREAFESYLPSAAHRASFPVQPVPSSSHFGNVPHYRVPAFTQPKVVGINHADTFQDRSLRSIFNKTRTLFKQGYRVVFNAEVEHSIKALQNQERRGQSIEMNRYRDPQVASMFRAAFIDGKAFNALLLTPDDAIVAGVVGYVHDNVYSPDSVFGDIDTVKVVDFALMRYLHARGIDFINAGMVTPYTESIKGYRITKQQYRELLTELPSEPVSLPPSGWQDAITIVTATAKTNARHVERLVAEGRVLTPLLLINSSSNERPALQSAKNNTRTTSLERLLDSVESYVIYEPSRPAQHGEGELPESLKRYLATIRSIEVVPVHKINFMQVSTLSGFPVSLIEELE